MSTIYDVAKKAGVAPSTVSRALNKSGYVSEKTRKAVAHAVRVLNYEPNALARGLTTNSTKTIGFVVSDISNPTYALMVRGAQDIARQDDYLVVIGNSDNDSKQVKSILQRLRSNRVDGFIVTNLENVDNKEVEKLLQVNIRLKIPTVVVGAFENQAVPVDILSIDNVEGGYIAAKHLLDLGYERIGIIAGPDIVITRERLEGVKKAYLEKSLVPDPDLVLTGTYKQDSGYDLMKQFIEMEQPPSAIFAFNDMMAMGALLALEEEGLSVPNDMRIVGFDDSPYATVVRPKLTTVATYQYEIGRRAVEVLLSRIALGMPSKQEKTVLVPRLVVRESSVTLRRT